MIKSDTKIIKLEEDGTVVLKQKGEFEGGRYSYLDAMKGLNVILELLEFDHK